MLDPGPGQSLRLALALAGVAALALFRARSSNHCQAQVLSSSLCHSSLVFSMHYAVVHLTCGGASTLAAEPGRKNCCTQLHILDTAFAMEMSPMTSQITNSESAICQLTEACHCCQ